MRTLDSVVVRKMVNMPYGHEMRYDSKEKRYYFLNHNKQTTSWDDPRTTLWKEWTENAVKPNESQLRDEKIILTIHPTVSATLIRYIFIATNFNVHETCKYLSDMGYKEVESLSTAKAKFNSSLSPRSNKVENASTKHSTNTTTTAANTAANASTNKTSAATSSTTPSSTTPKSTTPKNTTPKSTTPKAASKMNHKGNHVSYQYNETQEQIQKVLQVLEQTNLISGELIEDDVNYGPAPASPSSSNISTPKKSCYQGPDKDLPKGPDPSLALGPDPANQAGPDPLNVIGPQGSCGTNPEFITHM